ncbi:MAG TPA: thiamine pyrophosphate-dependent enzyme, partial [Novosphingobium sp.]|nr:thiamine pyrophosphate-dependent enzyme [Novosphingobium sp.]
YDLWRDLGNAGWSWQDVVPYFQRAETSDSGEGAWRGHAGPLRVSFPGRKVFAVCGDGGFMMNSQELETAVRLGLDLTVLILNDNAYGMIRWKQANMGFADFGLSYGNPDFVKYAESYGANGYRVESAAHLKDLLAHCRDTPGVHVIDCPVDYSENDRILNVEIKDLSRAL